MNLILTLKKVVKDCCTENDGVSFCPFRLMGFITASVGIPIFFGGTIWYSALSKTFDCFHFAQAFTTFMGGIALLATAVAIKAVTDTDNAP